MSEPGGKRTLFLLTDNGSIRARSALALREAAADLARQTGQDVQPASLAHCNRIKPEQLGGIPAQTLSDILLNPSLSEIRPIVILPFFLGNRGAIVEMVEKTIRETVKERPELSIRMAPFLFEEDGEDQEILAQAIAGRIREQINPTDPRQPNVILVDHGSPRPVAAQVRNFVAGQAQALLSSEVRSVIPASMERREGKQYAFTDPLLEQVLRRPQLQDRPFILAMFFLLPGRHAGEGGDVAEILEAAQTENPSLEVRTTDLLGNHPIVRNALTERIRDEANPAENSAKTSYPPFNSASGRA